MTYKKMADLTPPPPDRPVLSVTETAAMLSVSESTVRKAVKNETIPHFRFGTRILIKRVVIQELIDAASRNEP